MSKPTSVVFLIWFHFKYHLPNIENASITRNSFCQYLIKNSSKILDQKHEYNISERKKASTGTYTHVILKIQLIYFWSGSNFDRESVHALRTATFRLLVDCCWLLLEKPNAINLDNRDDVQEKIADKTWWDALRRYLWI